MATVNADFRSRLGKLLGMVGSPPERANALAAIEQALARAGESWAWIGSLVSHGDLPGGEREKILSRLIGDRLRGGLAHAWAMTDGDAKTLREIAKRCEDNLSAVSPADLSRAITIADEAKRKAGVRQ